MPSRIAEPNRQVDRYGYFGLADTMVPFRALDGWLRRRLRAVWWAEWKQPHTRLRMLRRLGVPEARARQGAWSHKGRWRVAGSPVLSTALPNRYWDDLGLQGFERSYRRVRARWRTAVCGPARTVVWEGAG